MTFEYVPTDERPVERRPDRVPGPGEATRSAMSSPQARLTERQQAAFVALVLEGKPLDELVAETGSARGAIYKTMFDARRKIRAALVTDGLSGTT